MKQSISDSLPGLTSMLEIRWQLDQIRKTIQWSKIGGITLRDLFEILEETIELIVFSIKEIEEIPYGQSKNPEISRIDSDTRPFPKYKKANRSYSGSDGRFVFHMQSNTRKPSREDQERYRDSVENHSLQPSTLSKKKKFKEKRLNDHSRTHLLETLDALQYLVGQTLAEIRLEKGISALARKTVVLPDSKPDPYEKVHYFRRKRRKQGRSRQSKK